MMFRSGAILALLLWLSTVAAQQWSIANITTCGLSCLLVTVPAANCSLSDTACQCKSGILPALTTACLLGNCTMHDQFVLAKVQASTCSLPHQDRSAVLIVIVSAAFSITSAFVALRLISRIWVSSTIGSDDWMIAFALILSLPSTAFTIFMAKEGFGKHVWDLNDGNLLYILRNFYIAENIYVVDLALTKISVLVLYLRIFPRESIRYVASATIGMIALSTTIIFFMTVFSCHPVAFFWNKDIRGGTCLNVNKLAYANSAMSIIQDLIVVALPLQVLAKLNMGRKKKIGVGFMFAIGSFGCVVSMIRLKSLLSFGNSLDPTSDYVDVVIWTIVELAVAMVCSSLPAIRTLLIRAYPRAFLSSIRHNDDKHPGETPWDSNAGRRHATHVSGDGFVELQQIHRAEALEDPPEVPPKDAAVSLHTKRVMPIRAARTPR